VEAFRCMEVAALCDAGRDVSYFGMWWKTKEDGRYTGQGNAGTQPSVVTQNS